MKIQAKPNHAEPFSNQTSENPGITEDSVTPSIDGRLQP